MNPSTLRRLALPLGCGLAALVLLLMILLSYASGFVPRALAQDVGGAALGALLASPPTCAQAAPDQQARLCDRADPIVGGCEAAAVTTQSIGLVDSDGQVVGRLDRRYSARCHSFWGRIFDYRVARPQGTVLVVQVGRDISTGPGPHELYSNMHYDTPGSPAPLVAGSVNGGPDGSFDTNAAGSGVIPPIDVGAGGN
jgi:hypothetical protein